MVKNSQFGFTLVELVMVIVLIGILAAYAAPKFNQNEFKVVEKAREVVEAIRYAQAQAMQHSGFENYYGIKFSGNGYQVATMTSDGNIASDNSVKNLTGSGLYVQSWSSGVSLSSSESTIFFNSRGMPLKPNSGSGAVDEIDNDVTITITIGSVSKALTLYQLTGFVAH
ncbi:type II secretion system protein [Ectothiorhodospiraceae bacterium BW-2]|nr:type II secretion system protein [Ectothiorhodospiraceae bacterium BW-2]